jgi:hypothetical protein
MIWKKRQVIFIYTQNKGKTINRLPKIKKDYSGSGHPDIFLRPRGRSVERAVARDVRVHMSCASALRSGSCVMCASMHARANKSDRCM